MLASAFPAGNAHHQARPAALEVEAETRQGVALAVDRDRDPGDAAPAASALGKSGAISERRLGRLFPKLTSHLISAFTSIIPDDHGAREGLCQRSTDNS